MFMSTYFMPVPGRVVGCTAVACCWFTYVADLFLSRQVLLLAALVHYVVDLEQYRLTSIFDKPIQSSSYRLSVVEISADCSSILIAYDRTSNGCRPPPLHLPPTNQMYAGDMSRHGRTILLWLHISTPVQQQLRRYCCGRPQQQHISTQSKILDALCRRTSR